MSVIEEIVAEYSRACGMHPAMNSAHEGFAVLQEEVDELWHEVKHGTPAQARAEAIQVAAMALRLICNIYDKKSE